MTALHLSSIFGIASAVFGLLAAVAWGFTAFALFKLADLHAKGPRR